MKVVIIADGDAVSPHYRRAEKLVIIDTEKNEKKEEKISCSCGRELALRINEIAPNALILHTLGPGGFHWLDKKIHVYMARAGMKIDEALEKLEKKNFSDDFMPLLGSTHIERKGKCEELK
jgi:predicted Fe-Mo cluster-binding NifX family protein